MLTADEELFYLATDLVLALLRERLEGAVLAKLRRYVARVIVHELNRVGWLQGARLSLTNNFLVIQCLALSLISSRHVEVSHAWWDDRGAYVSAEFLHGLFVFDELTGSVLKLRLRGATITGSMSQAVAVNLIKDH